MNRLLFFAIAVAGFGPAISQEAVADSDSSINPRHLKKKLCSRLGICGGGYGGYGGDQGYGGYQGYGSFQGYSGYQGYGQPPINIAISQSQSSANEGGDEFSNGYYPNNYQYNGYGGYRRKPAYGYGPNYGYRPGYYGGYNSQFNGNYYGYDGYDYQGYGDDSYDRDYDRSGYDGDDFGQNYGRSSNTVVSKAVSKS